jgi:hypothetical protein
MRINFMLQLKIHTFLTLHTTERIKTVRNKRSERGLDKKRWADHERREEVKGTPHHAPISTSAVTSRVVPAEADSHGITGDVMGYSAAQLDHHTQQCLAASRTCLYLLPTRTHFKLWSSRFTESLPDSLSPKTTSRYCA